MRRMKKVLCLLLAVSLLLSLAAGMETKAADSISVSNATYPDWIKKGSAFILRGTVKSDSNITELTASICDGHGNAMYSKTVKPNSKTYDLKGIDAAMRFDKLSANPYTYRVVAKNSSGTNTVILKPFTVYSGNKPVFNGSLNTSVKYQLCVKEDSSMVVDIAGTTSSSNVLVKKDEGQTSSYWYLESAGESAYMIRNADTGLYLDVAGGAMTNGTNIQLWTGNATDAQKWYFIQDGDAFKIISKRNYLTMSLENSLAKNKPNVQVWRDIEVAHQRFYLKPVTETNNDPENSEEPVITSALAISDANTVPTLNIGDKFSLKGTITSDYPITKVIVDIYSGSSPIVRKEVYPNTTSVSLSGDIDKAMTFNTLAAGTYYYSVWAEDASGAQKTLIWQIFEVKKGSYPEISYKVKTVIQKHYEGCALAAAATCLKSHGINATYDWAYKKNKNSVYVNWSNFSMKRVKVSDQQKALSGLYDTLKNKGVVVVGRSNGKSGSAYRSHFSVVVAYKGNSEKLEMKGFIVQDVYDGKTVNLETWAKRQSSKWRNYYYYTK